MKVFAIDPSSTSCGYAILTAHNQLIECGRVTPDAADAMVDRAWAMGGELAELITEHRPEIVYIEIPADQAPHGKASSAHQSTYGIAVGIIYARIKGEMSLINKSYEVQTIQSDKWKRMVYRSKASGPVGRAKREERSRKLRFMFPSYGKAHDPKQDVADAIEIGMWWFSQRMKPTAVLESEAA